MGELDDFTSCSSFANILGHKCVQDREVGLPEDAGTPASCMLNAYLQMVGELFHNGLYCEV